MNKLTNSDKQHIFCLILIALGITGVYLGVEAAAYAIGFGIFLFIFT